MITAHATVNWFHDEHTDNFDGVLVVVCDDCSGPGTSQMGQSSVDITPGCDRDGVRRRAGTIGSPAN